MVWVYQPVPECAQNPPFIWRSDSKYWPSALEMNFAGYQFMATGRRYRVPWNGAAGA